MRGESNTGDWKPGDPIGYIRQEIPEFDVPAYEGEHYEAMVPDTLDLQARAALGVHVMTSITDPLADYEIYFWARFLTNPPSMVHDYSDLCVMKFMEALPLLRIASGSDASPEVERRWMEVALHQLGPDGLAYWPTKGRPWALIGTWDVFVPPDTGTTRAQLLFPIYCGRLLSAMVLFYRRDGAPLWKDAAERLVDGLVDLAVDRGRYAYFSPLATYAERGSTVDGGRDDHLVGACSNIITQGLVHVYRETGYEPARQLAEKLIRYTLDEIRYFDGEGRFMPDQPADPGWMGQSAHFHEHTRDLQAFLEYALLTDDAELLELVCKGYEFAKAHGNVLLGYFPEFLYSPQVEQSELCEVADMIALALKLSEAGLGDYWDDADRWARNMFAEGQLTRSDWIDGLHQPGPEKGDEKDFPESVIGFNETTERVAERLVGAFAGYPTANDWWPGRGKGTMHCCTGNGTRATYYLWEHILRHENGRLRVNLLLNRASPWADVDSHIPYVGQVDVKVKQPVDLSIRIPEWVAPDEVRVRVNGEERRVGFEGRYAQVGEVQPGEVATMSFPIAERREGITVEKAGYTVIRKGNEVVKIDPPGKYCPLYQRDHYRENSTRWRKIDRFVSNERITW